MSLILNYTAYLIGTFTKIFFILTTTYIIGFLIIAANRRWGRHNPTSSTITNNKSTPLAELHMAYGAKDKDYSLGTDSSGTTRSSPVQLGTVYELKESLTTTTFDEPLVYSTIHEDRATLPLRTMIKAPSPQPSLSSPPSMDSSHYSRRRANTQPFNRTYSVYTPPLTMTPSLSTSTTDSSQTHSPVLSPSASSHRRNSRVGQLVHKFEMGYLDTARPTPIKMEGGTKVSDTITSLYKVNKGNPRSTHTIRSDPASPTVCHSPNPISAAERSRTIDHRSIGFRPVFTTWEKRATEANTFFVPSPSLSTPVRSSARRLSKTG